MDGCCSPRPTPKDVRDVVREGYAKVARAGAPEAVGLPVVGGGCCGGSGVPVLSPDELAARIGYAPDEVRGLPEGANMGLSCGNPTAIAALRPGEVVLDLGSGGGFDVFLAGPRVGPQGRAIGVDMTPEMLAKARRNAASYRERTGLDNVEFRLGEIEHLPVADASVDAVISNCVINLSPDKPRVWREIARVLRPGGRVAASDMALLQPLPEDVRTMVEALVGCVAGAVTVDEYREMVETAGLVDVVLQCKPAYVEALSASNDPLYARISASLPAGHAVAEYVTSLDVTARRPAAGSPRS